MEPQRRFRVSGQGGDLLGRDDLHELFRAPEPLPREGHAAHDPRTQACEKPCHRRSADDLHCRGQSDPEFGSRGGCSLATIRLDGNFISLPMVA